MGEAAGEASLPEAAWLTALAGLPEVGPTRLAGLVALAGSPRSAWGALASGRAPAGLRRRLGARADRLLARWSAVAAATDVATVWADHVTAGVDVLVPGAPGWPPALDGDPHAPAVLFARGALDALHAPAVAVVGTRACTTYGRSVATELGRDLAGAGVAVVSGLALGIDGAVHRGALAAADPLAVDGDRRQRAERRAGRPVGVVGSGLDVAYPPRHHRLWQQVAEVGLLLSEHPLGVAPAPWRFPARNRIIAALAAVTVVVESHATGGALGTAVEAADRGRVVLAVPGPVASGASDGTNALLADGAGVCRGAQDVLDVLGLVAPPPTPSGRATVPSSIPSPVDPGHRAVLDALGWEPATLEQLVLRVGGGTGGLGRVATALGALVVDGHVVERGGWYERAGVDR